MRKTIYLSPRLVEASVSIGSICTTSSGWDNAINDLYTKYDENTDLE